MIICLLYFAGTGSCSETLRRRQQRTYSYLSMSCTCRKQSGWCIQSWKGNKFFFAGSWNHQIKVNHQHFWYWFETISSRTPVCCNSLWKQENCSLIHCFVSNMVELFSFLCGRFGEDSVEFADSSFVVASGYINDESNHKAKKYLDDAITLYMKHKGPYHNWTIKAQVCSPGPSCSKAG